MGSQLDSLPLSRVGSWERATKSQFPQLDFVKPSSGFHPVTWERVNQSSSRLPQTTSTHLIHISHIANKGLLQNALHE
jgi:hypothetical protein